MEQNKICILLSVYNGSHYIEEQLNSITTQDHTNLEILIRDDASQDNSLKILKHFAKQDSRITLIQDSFGNNGVNGNLNLLMKNALQTSSQYFAFADQDDVWQPDKLSSQLTKMQRAQTVYCDEPILVYSDMEVVDALLTPISPSFMEYQGISNVSKKPLNILLTQNFIPGCTMLINRKLLEMVVPVPRGVLMYDWWIALCAATLGQIKFIAEPLVKYRQHGSNVVGARSIYHFINPFKSNWLDLWLTGKKNLLKSIFQAQALDKLIVKLDPSNQYSHLIKSYASILEQPPVQRVVKLFHQGILPQPKIRQLLNFSRILFLSKNSFPNC
jgi:rhamnosyltransferase